MTYQKNYETATLGGGCFWGIEHAFKQVRGVVRVVPGYAGGHVPNPTYEQVKTGTTGHAEVVQITYDPQAVGYDDLLEVFFAIHDPTTPDRQGPDVGPQYRSIILYHDEDQHQRARQWIKKMEKQLSRPVVTELAPFRQFYPAEEYHMDYYERHPEHQAACPALKGLHRVRRELLIK